MPTSTLTRFAAAPALFVLIAALPAGTASAATIVPCSGNCTWSMAIDGQQVRAGEYQVDPVTGNITAAGTGRVRGQASGTWVEIERLSGNADPILGFSVNAGTGAVGSTYSFTFNLPIALSGQIVSSSSVSYSLTSQTAAGAQVAPLLGSNVVNAFEVDTSVGGLQSLNKGVDIGNAFFFLGGPQTQNSSVQTASGSLTGDLAYDLMSVTVAFSLSANSQVGVSGFVQQEEVPAVPLPPALWLLGSSIAGLVGMARRKSLSQAAAAA